MHGILPKRIAAANLQCAKCAHFKDDDPDIFYCERGRPEFAALCEEYEYCGSESVKLSGENKGVL